MSALTAAAAATSAAEAAQLAKTTKKRKALHAYLSDGAHETWHQFAATNGISVSATLESLAVELEQTGSAASIDFHPIVARARQTDANRRRRRR